VTEPVLKTFRDLVRRRSPPWLQRGLAEKILYSIAIQLDAFGDALDAGVKLRFPGVYSAESLPVLSRERRIIRGRNEGELPFSARLARWFVDHRYRGGPYAMLTQLYYHYLPTLITIDLLYANGRRYRLDSVLLAGGTPIDEAITRDLTGFVPVDGDTAKWARWWLIFYTDQWAVTPPTDTEIQDLRLLPRAWNAAHCFGTIVLFPGTGELWNWPPGRTWNELGTWNVTGGTTHFIDVEPT
jgi:hypothetical protein